MPKSKLTGGNQITIKMNPSLTNNYKGFTFKSIHLIYAMKN